ncbi:MAG: hypothetical protein SFW62_01540 [Alphaproteobacteria bacterium]|nr:hypothetical protein [Alphaproteobacteria bacterium]
MALAIRVETDSTEVMEEVRASALSITGRNRENKLGEGVSSFSFENDEVTTAMAFDADLSRISRPGVTLHHCIFAGG